MPTCSKCHSQIAADDVNVAQNVAFCRVCNKAAKLSDLAEGTSGPTVDPASPPKGAWFQDRGSEQVIGATTRHPSAFFMVPFACVWSGGALGGIYGMQIASGKFSLALSLFGIPFVLGSIALWSAVAMAIAGRTEVQLQGEKGTIFTGVGSLGVRRRFDTAEISRVYEDRARWHGVGSYGGSIVLEGKRRLKFGEGLREERRYFVFKVLQALLAGQN